ncbi:MAG: hypothetical protein ACYC4U_18010 [Pirellulaceae bacterium]
MSHNQTASCRSPAPATDDPGRLPFGVGTAIANITPPLEVGILMSSVERRWAPFESVRLPLHARAAVIESGGTRVAVVALELLGLSEEGVGGMARFRERIIVGAGDCVADDHLVLTSIHTHSAPETLALSDLRHTPAYQKWTDLLADRIGQVLRNAAAALRPCRLAIAQAVAPELGVHRRIHTTRGILMSHPPVPPEIVISRAGAVDDSVHVAVWFDAAVQPVAILVNAACHPVHEMCLPAISPDYPGITSATLERRFPGASVLFFNGACGNVNPPTVSGGPGEAERHGHRLARLVEEMIGHSRPVDGTALDIRWSPIHLSRRPVAEMPASERVEARIAAIRAGEAAFLFLPGEPFAETALAVRKASAFPFTAVIGYAEGSIGYIPTDAAFAEGGYETGPGGWSYLVPGSESIVQAAASDLLDRLQIG